MVTKVILFLLLLAGSLVKVNVAAIVVSFISKCLWARESTSTVKEIDTWSILPTVA